MSRVETKDGLGQSDLFVRLPSARPVNAVYELQRGKSRPRAGRNILYAGIPRYHVYGNDLTQPDSDTAYDRLISRDLPPNPLPNRTQLFVPGRGACHRGRERVFRDTATAAASVTTRRRQRRISSIFMKDTLLDFK